MDYAGYTKRTFHAGEAFMEGMDVAHFGVNSGKQTMRLLAVYMGAQGAGRDSGELEYFPAKWKPVRRRKCDH